MHPMRRAPLCALALVGCVSVEAPIDWEFDAAGVGAVEARVERGSVSARSAVTDRFVIEALSIGRGSSEERAAAREAGNAVNAAVMGGVLAIDAASAERRASVEVDLVGPDAVDLDLEVEDGSVIVQGFEGEHRLVGAQIVTTRLMGAVVAEASQAGMDLEVWPWLDGGVEISSRAGDVVLRLPYGGDYAVEVWGDDLYEMYVTDLGFTASIAEPGYFNGTVGAGSIPVRVTVQGGAFELLEAF